MLESQIGKRASAIKQPIGSIISELSGNDL
jgi:hypothetical protein